MIVLDEPVRAGGVLLLKIADVNAKAKCTSSTKFNAQFLDEKKKSALNISIFPKSGWIFLSTPSDEVKLSRPFNLNEMFTSKADHNIVVRKHDNQFHVLCDLSLVGTVGGTTSSSKITAVSYDLGVGSPFKGPLVATVYPDVTRLSAELPSDRSKFPVVDKETLFQQILCCDPGDGDYITKTLSTIRNENTVFMASSSGIKWKSQVNLVVGWNKIDGSMDPHSVLMARFAILPPGPVQPSNAYIAFGPSSCYQLQAGFKTDKTVQFEGYNASSQVEDYGTLELSRAIHTAGEHCVAFIHQGNNLHVIIDFCRTIVCRKTLKPKPNEMYFNIFNNENLILEVYEFGK